MLTTTLPAKKGDGTPEFVLTLAAALGREHEVTVLAPRVRGGAKTEVVDGVRIERFAYFPHRWEGIADGAILPNLKADPWRLVEVPFLVAAFIVKGLLVATRKRPQVVNAHWMVPAGLVGMLIRKTLGIPYVLTVHGADTYALNGRVSRWLKRKVLSSAHTVTSVSREIAGLLHISDLDVDRLVVPMGVDTEAIRSSVEPRQPIPGRLLFIGRLAEKKGVDVLLRAVAQVPRAKVVLVGGGPEESHLRQQTAKLGIEQQVEFLGQQTRPRVMEEMRLAHAVVIPSKVARDGDREGTPVVMAEAMAAGVPVIASNLAGLGEHIVSGQSGLLVEPGSTDSLTQALVALLHGALDLDLWVENAQRHAKTALGLSAMKDRYSEFLSSAASETNDRRR